MSRAPHALTSPTGHTRPVGGAHGTRRVRAARVHCEPGRHRAERRSLTDVMPPLAVSVPALGGLAGTLSVAAAALLPGAAAAAPTGTNNTSGQPAVDAVSVAVPAGARFAAPATSDLLRLRMCESTDNYGVATGNGFYGAYQFDLQTWRSLGLSGMPQQAAPLLQDAAAAALEQSRGWEPWPACSSHLGLVPNLAHSLPVAQVAGTLTPAAGGAQPVVAVKPAGGKHRAAVGSGPTALPPAAAPTHTAVAPPFPGQVLSTSDGASYRSDVRAWQERMAARGWDIAPDGYFGPITQAVARAFASQKHLDAGLPGEVNAAVWTAAWTAPVN